MKLTNFVVLLLYFFLHQLCKFSLSLNFSCMAEHSLKPMTDKNSQLLGDSPPPYQFYVLKSNGDPTRHFTTDETYTVKINGSSNFRDFVIQARQATKGGFVLEDSRTGEFIKDKHWKRQGVRMMPCLHFDTVTNSNSRDKSTMDILWKPTEFQQNVQFMVTISKDDDTFWIQWAPRTGLLFPEDYRPKGKYGSSESTSTFDPNQLHLLQHSVPMAHEIQLASTSSNIIDQITKLPRLKIADQNHQLITPDVFAFDENSQSKLNGGVDRVIDPFGNKRIVVKPTTQIPEIDYCKNHTCQNNATCSNLPFQETFECHCLSKWVGQFCDKINPCFSNTCQNFGECSIDVDTDQFEQQSNTVEFMCKCHAAFSGRLCQHPCPTYLCQNGGTCSITDAGEYICLCKPGLTGSKCESEVNPCQPNPCQNNGTCTSLPEGEFQCQCDKGYMGRRCHRPCQDVYQSCNFWKEQDKCEDMRPSTKFFDVNCASSCDQCVFDHSTIRTQMSLPPLLEPFEFILGHWVTESTSEERFPINFETAKQGFKQTLNFLVANVTMFNTPLLNFSCEAVNNLDPDDVQKSVGFLTLRLEGPDMTKAWAWSTGNDGVTVIEEGSLKNEKINLKSTFIYSTPLVNLSIPKQIRRTLRLSNVYLEERVQRTSFAGSTYEFTRYYKRSQSYVIY